MSFVKIFVNFVVEIFYHKGHKGIHKEHKVYDVVWYNIARVTIGMSRLKLDVDLIDSHFAF